MSDTVVITARWCLTEDESRVVPETDVEARWLHWRPGDVVSRAEAERLGAVKKPPAPAAPKRKPVHPPVAKTRVPSPSVKTTVPKENK